MSELRCDVLVAGGGLVGATAALALARSGASVALLDRVEPASLTGRLGFDVRTVALNPASADLLREIGVWDSFAACPFDKVHVCEALGTRFIDFAASEVARDELGWIVEVSPAVHVLWSALRSCDELTVLTGTIDAVSSDADAVSVQSNDMTISAGLLLAADGANSAVRAHLGIDAARFATGQAAVATVVETQRDHGNTAWQCFLRDGPVALLPLPSRGGRFFCSVVWTQSEAAAAQQMQRSDAAFIAQLEAACDRCWGAILAVDQRFSFALEQQVASTFAPTPRVLLVGDAARVLHPLAGQGVNLGFEDIREVLRVAGRVDAAALGDAGLWRGFERRRQLRAQLMVRAMDAFAAAYRISDPGLQWLRNMAVQLLNEAPSLKRQLIKEALGYGIFAAPR